MWVKDSKNERNYNFPSLPTSYYQLKSYSFIFVVKTIAIYLTLCNLWEQTKGLDRLMPKVRLLKMEINNHILHPHLLQYFLFYPFLQWIIQQHTQSFKVSDDFSKEKFIPRETFPFFLHTFRIPPTLVRELFLWED